MSLIQWTDETWNPVTGCTKVSAGCKNCYAERQAMRLQKMGQSNYADGFAVRCHPHMLEKPINWKRPRRIFVNSMSDLFHEDVPFDFVERVFSVMAAAQQHQFQILTKRPERMLEFFRDTVQLEDAIIYLGQHWTIWDGRGQDLSKYQRRPQDLERRQPWPGWPLPNVWLGTSVENTKTIERIRFLKECPAKVHFVSFEPLLEDVCCGHLADVVDHSLDWAIVGGESGPGARPCEEEWIESLIRFCQWHSVPVFVKQMGSVWAKANRTKHPKAGDPDEWPENLRVREFPSFERQEVPQ